jgi:hypothetical protein
MFNNHLLFAIVVAVAGCGGGGEDSSERETGFLFLESDPTEELLCSFVIGVTTQSEVVVALGEPTHYSENTLGSVLQYWIGSEAELGTSGLRAVLFSFDEEGKLDSPSVQQVPFPQCWRQQLDAADRASGAP